MTPTVAFKKSKIQYKTHIQTLIPFNHFWKQAKVQHIVQRTKRFYLKAKNLRMVILLRGRNGG
jgi:hypothetical protein